MSPEQPEIGYEEARQQLAEVVNKLESGGVPLAESMQLWEQGEKLAAICQQWLDGAKAKVEAGRQTAHEGQTPQSNRPAQSAAPHAAATVREPAEEDEL